MSSESHSVDFYQSQFATREAMGGEPSWLAALRNEAFVQFAAEGFPTTALEEWRYTNMAALEAVRFAPGRGAQVDRACIEALAHPVYACSLFVFVDGRFAPGLSTPSPRSAGLPFEPLASALQAERTALGRVGEHKGHPFAALNTALFEDGAHIRVEDGRVEEEPIHLVFVSSAPGTSHPRVLIEAGAQSHVTVIQDHVSLTGAASFSNSVSEVTLGPNASVDLVVLQRESSAAFHVSNMADRKSVV